MKLPDIKSRRNRIRDSAICTLWLEGKTSLEDMSSRFKISTRQISRVVYKNRSVLKIEADYEKIKRIKWLRQQIGNRKSNKDPADLQEQMRKEIEGESNVLIDQSTTNHITYAWNNNNDKIQPADVSERNTRGQAQIQSPEHR